jgi:hypothetical protein
MQHDTNIFGQSIGLVIPNWKVPIFPTDEPIEGRFCRIERLDPSLHARSLYAANMLDVEGKMWTYLRYGPFATLESYIAWAETMRCSSDPLIKRQKKLSVLQAICGSTLPLVRLRLETSATRHSSNVLLWLLRRCF